MIDLHCHLLPGVDDGADDLAQAIAMCHMAVEDGVEAIVATPHLRHEMWWNDDRASLETAFASLRAGHGTSLEVHLGGEIAVCSHSFDEMLQSGAGDLLPLAGSRYLLLELPHHGVGIDPLELVYELQVAGWYPVLAHPERIAWLAQDRGLLDELVAQKAHLQLTAMSISGRLGSRMERLCRSWIDDGLVHFVASDGHDTRIRTPLLSEAYQTLTRGWGEETARKLLIDHPRAVLEDRPLDQPDSATVHRLAHGV